MAGNAPMSLARFMELALMDSEFGYYSTKKTIFNKGGDFTTSPEISQMFGEMIGVWLMTALKNYDSNPKKISDGMPTIPENVEEQQPELDSKGKPKFSKGFGKNK